MKEKQESPLRIMVEYIIMLVYIGIGSVLYIVGSSGESSDEFSILFIAFSGILLINAIGRIGLKLSDSLERLLEHEFPNRWWVSPLAAVPTLCSGLFLVSVFYELDFFGKFLPLGTIFCIFIMIISLVKFLKRKTENSD